MNMDPRAKFHLHNLRNGLFIMIIFIGAIIVGSYGVDQKNVILIYIALLLGVIGFIGIGNLKFDYKPPDSK